MVTIIIDTNKYQQLLTQWCHNIGDTIVIVITDTIFVTPQISVTIVLTVRLLTQLTSFTESNY